MGRGGFGSNTTKNNETHKLPQHLNSGIKLASFKQYFERMIGGGGTTKNIEKKMSEMSGFDFEMMK